MSSSSLNIHDISLSPATVVTTPDGKYLSENRIWQGIPGIERTAKGRLFATWYSGGKTEEPGNFVVMVKSDDDGNTWTEPVVAVDPSVSCDKMRAYDPVIWIDPLGRLWLIWAQSYTFYNGRAGVWFIRCDNPDADELVWTEPARIGNGIMMNKPTVLSSGEWLFPISLWGYKGVIRLPELEEECKANVFCTTDNGESFERLGGVDAACRSFDEHMVVEKEDGSLWMLIRTFYGIAQSESFDKGKNWTRGRASEIENPDTRFHIRRLKSGSLLLINHFNYTGRSHMTARISKDDGKTWIGGLLLDERSNVSYPDAMEADNGMIYAVHDHNRGNNYHVDWFDRNAEREILMSVFSEEDVLRGEPSDSTRLKVVINRATGEFPI